MKTVFYKLDCLTNLHVGSGDVNYSIVDNEVEKDPVTGLPMIHASGVKGALRDVIQKKDEALANRIFGAPGDKDAGKPGNHKFFDAYLLTRPMRAAGSNSLASVSVTTVAAVNLFLASLSAFGCNDFGIDCIDEPDFGENQFLTNVAGIRVEGEPTGSLGGAVLEQLEKLASVLGKQFALVKSFDDYPLPVMARNHLENGISKNLWYEEVVPHGSVLYFAVMAPEAEMMEMPEMVQFGGNASIGCGFTKVVKL